MHAPATGVTARVSVACAEPCNLHGVCQTNNTCARTEGYTTCWPQTGTLTSATAGCEINVYTGNQNCGTCGNGVNTGEQYGSDERVDACKSLLGSVNIWNVRRLPNTARSGNLSVSASPTVLGPDMLPVWHPRTKLLQWKDLSMLPCFESLGSALRQQAAKAAPHAMCGCS